MKKSRFTEEKNCVCAQVKRAKNIGRGEVSCTMGIGEATSTIGSKDMGVGSSGLRRLKPS